MPSLRQRLKQMISSILILLISVLGVIYASSIAFAYSLSDKLIFPDTPSSYQDDKTILKLNSGDGETLSAIYLTAKDPDTLLLYSHGNAQDIGNILPLLKHFQAQGISVLAYDYPGYGTSTGKPSEKGVYAAADTAYTYATKDLGYAPGAITLYGRSLGSGPSCWLAERYSVGGLILNGAFSSTFRVMTHIKILPFDKFDNLSRLPSIKCPVLLIHGTADEVVPFEHALQNSAAIKGPKQELWVEGAGHNNLIDSAGALYWDNVLPFIRQIN